MTDIIVTGKDYNGNPVPFNFKVVTDGNGGTAYRPYVEPAPLTPTSIAASHAADTVVRASAGTLVAVVLLGQAVVDVQVFDNASAASGTQLGETIPAGSAPEYYDMHNVPALLGITVKGSASNPAMTIITRP